MRLVNECFDMEAAPLDWRGASIAPLYKRKGERMNVITREVLPNYKLSLAVTVRTVHLDTIEETP